MPKKRFRKILYDFGNLITNMKNDAWVSLIIGFYGMLKTSSKIQTTIDELTFFSEGIGSFVVYPVALVLTFIGFWFCAYLIVQVIGDCFKWASRFHFKKREAKIDFLVHQDGNSVVFEVRNLERQLDIDSVSVFFYTVDQIQDKYGKLPFDHEVFTRNYFGKNHELSEKRELAWRDGGGKKVVMFISPQGNQLFIISLILMNMVICIFPKCSCA